MKIENGAIMRTNCHVYGKGGLVLPLHSIVHVKRRSKHLCDITHIAPPKDKVKGVAYTVLERVPQDHWDEIFYAAPRTYYDLPTESIARKHQHLPEDI